MVDPGLARECYVSMLGNPAIRIEMGSRTELERLARQAFLASEVWLMAAKQSKEGNDSGGTGPEAK
jgi:hypothetical protein